MACFEHAPPADASVHRRQGVELTEASSLPQDFLPDGSSDWARLHFAGRKGGFELVVGRMIGVVKGAEKRRTPIFRGRWRRKAHSSSGFAGLLK